MYFPISERRRIEGNIALFRVMFFLLMLMLAIALGIAGLEHPLPRWFGWLFWITMAVLGLLATVVRWFAKRLAELRE